jgi:hypothetical protein
MDRLGRLPAGEQSAQQRLKETHARAMNGLGHGLHVQVGRAKGLQVVLDDDLVARPNRLFAIGLVRGLMSGRLAWLAVLAKFTGLDRKGQSSQNTEKGGDAHRKEREKEREKYERALRFA